jgi:hypothetical protein
MDDLVGVKVTTSTELSQPKLYEFGDIDFRHTFQNAVDHEVILQARIAGDQHYQNNPLVASYDLRVWNQGAIGVFAESLFATENVSLLLNLFVFPILLLL